MIKIVKTGKQLDVTKPEYKADGKKHSWDMLTPEKRKEQ
jgi:hypothetical protein